eukprot:2861354-Prymnesium_polylepis.1
MGRGRGVEGIPPPQAPWPRIWLRYAIVAASPRRPAGKAGKGTPAPHTQLEGWLRFERMSFSNRFE